MTEEVVDPVETTEESPKDGEEVAKEVETPKEDEEIEIDPDVRDYKPENDAKPDDDEEIDPEDEKKIEKIIQKRYGGDVEALKKQVAIDAYFNANPTDTKYRVAAEKYLNHPTYKGIPVHNIVAIVSAKDRERIGAQKEREAAAKVKETKATGDTARKTVVGAIDWHNSTPEQFAAQRAKVMGRPGR